MKNQSQGQAIAAIFAGATASARASLALILALMFTVAILTLVMFALLSKAGVGGAQEPVVTGRPLFFTQHVTVSRRSGNDFTTRNQ